jgi:plastocyanin
MKRSHLVLGFAALALMIGVPASAMSAMSAKKLTGTVGPGFTITLKSGSKKVSSLPAGKYTIAVSDKSDIHNFRLKGPGVNKEITSVSFKGSKSYTATLKKGKYTFVCDPHASIMKGSFTVK